MAEKTNPELRNAFIYQVYPRNHSEAGTLSAIIDDLDRIKALGVDIIYLLPIHPIGRKRRKGGLGSPYSIRDYTAIDESLGTMEDFQSLIDAVHRRDMKLMMDIVFNHTAWDSALFENHPGFFYREDGEFKNRVGEWWDVVDFDFTRDERLWETLIDVLVMYAKKGVDGFRFDVAGLLPLAFLRRARRAVEAVAPDTIWLAESIHTDFVRHFRNQGFEALSDSELLQVFDMAYDYDADPFFKAYLDGEGTLSEYVEWLLVQESIYPGNYIKLRHLENHDHGRIARWLDSDIDALKNWHAFSFFSRGSTLVYAGGEYFDTHHPDLFNKDPVRFEGTEHTAFFRRLKTITSDTPFYRGAYDLLAHEAHQVVGGSYRFETVRYTGVFSFAGRQGEITTDLEDGTYTNLIDDSAVTVKEGRLALDACPLIIKSDAG